MTTKRSSTALAIALSLSFFAVGCKKKVPAPPPPPPPPAKVDTPAPKAPVARPIIRFFTAEPTSIERGQASSLKWEVVGADSASINQGIGSIGAGANIAGNRSVFPSSTTTYTLTARNAGGEASESVTVNVTAPPAKPAPTPAPAKASFSEVIARDINDAFFDFDKSDLREDARNTLTQNADKLKAIFRDYPNGSLTLEGHADERGSAEYNLGLGDRRAIAAKEFLTQLGVPADRLRTLSYGKERPQCTDNNEGCWQKNRRVHFTGQ
ncbi:MAG: OmpA family protein [Acidobacteria bacterium]|nr:OmpA family protein [Acidobacteriota bacterium]